MKPLNSPEKIKAIQKWVATGTVNIFGLPFAGKDTQGKFLSEVLNAPLIGSGDILRSSQNDKVKKIIGTGKLAPSDDFLKIVLPFLAQDEFDGKPLVLSSVGRWFGEQEGVLEASMNAGHPCVAVVYLKMPEDVMHARWEIAHQSGDRGKREDDAHGALDTRLQEFRTKTLPVINYYRNLNLLIEVDGSNPAKDVQEEIIEKLYERSLL